MAQVTNNLAVAVLARVMKASEIFPVFGVDDSIAEALHYLELQPSDIDVAQVRHLMETAW